MGGNVQVGSLYLVTGKTLAISTEIALNGAAVCVDMDTAGVFATNVLSEAVASCFSNEKHWQTEYDPDAKTLSFTE